MIFVMKLSSDYAVSYEPQTTDFLVSSNITERAGVAVTLQTRIREVLGSNLGWNTRHPDSWVFVVFLSPSI
jgi:hypothetical protein